MLEIGGKGKVEEKGKRLKQLLIMSTTATTPPSGGDQTLC